MKITKLARLFELKYNLKSEGSSINDIKKNIINAYNLYVNSDKAKDPVLQILANAGEPFSKSLIFEMEKMVANIDNLANQPDKLFQEIVRILDGIAGIKSDPEKKVRNFIHDSIRVTKESEKNYREHLKSKFEMVLYRLYSILEKQMKILNAFVSKDNISKEQISTEKKELSKEKLLMFMRTPAAQVYGLDNMDVILQIMSYSDSKSRLTTLINAIDRGHVPVDGAQVMSEARDIKNWLNDKQKNNITTLEQAPEKSAPDISLLEKKYE